MGHKTRRSKSKLGPTAQNKLGPWGNWVQNWIQNWVQNWVHNWIQNWVQNSSGCKIVTQRKRHMNTIRGEWLIMQMWILHGWPECASQAECSGEQCALILALLESSNYMVIEAQVQIRMRKTIFWFSRRSKILGPCLFWGRVKAAHDTWRGANSNKEALQSPALSSVKFLKL